MSLSSAAFFWENFAGTVSVFASAPGTAKAPLTSALFCARGCWAAARPTLPTNASANALVRKRSRRMGCLLCSGVRYGKARRLGARSRATASSGGRSADITAGAGIWFHAACGVALVRARLPPNRKPASVGAAGLSLAALGVVFGDIGTSPLYTLKTVLNLTGANPDASTTLGALSLILWTLFVVTTIKYVNFAMRIDNDGEGGIIALLALLGVKKQHRPAIVAAGLFGAALIYGDGTITPAISVLSALEGMEQIAPSLQTYVLPASVIVLFALFAVQPLGTGKIGRAFGPVMLAWFAVMALLGVYGITQHVGVVAAINPLYGI